MGKTFISADFTYSAYPPSLNTPMTVNWRQALSSPLKHISHWPQLTPGAEQHAVARL